MLQSCTSICCCFSCKKETKIENVEDQKWKEKNKIPSKKPANSKNITRKSSTDDDVRIICEANLQDVLTNQNDSQKSIYRFVSSNESRSMSLHESVIEEEEIDDAEVCDSIVYVVDGDPIYMKDHDHHSGSNEELSDGESIDDNSGSGYSSDVTIINTNIGNSSPTNQVFDSPQLPIRTNLENAKKDELLERQREVHKHQITDNSQGNEVKQKSSPSPVRNTDYKSTQNCDIKNFKLEHTPDESFSKQKSSLCKGKVRNSYLFS